MLTHIYTLLLQSIDMLILHDLLKIFRLLLYERIKYTYIINTYIYSRTSFSPRLFAAILFKTRADFSASQREGQWSIAMDQPPLFILCVRMYIYSGRVVKKGCKLSICMRSDFCGIFVFKYWKETSTLQPRLLFVW